MKVISIFDTSISSSNLGDKIIMDSVRSNLGCLFPDALFIPIQTHDRISWNSYDYIRQSDLKIVGGTNLLSSNLNRYRQWKIGLWDSLFIKDVVLMGVGWWQYQGTPNLYTRLVYHRVLSNSFLHAVRDSYTESQLARAGIKNLINTSCPTMWNLNKGHCREVPRTKAKNVLVTYTEYNQDPDYDRKLFDVLDANYEKIYYWTQQPKDYSYMKEIGGGKVIYIPPNLEALDAVFSNDDVDYVGTRLHAGIRALQHKRRTIVLAVDNRAQEIHKDTNLPVVDRKDITQVKQLISSSFTTDINLPEKNIENWKQQFLNMGT